VGADHSLLDHDAKDILPPHLRLRRGVEKEESGLELPGWECFPPLVRSLRNIGRGGCRPTRATVRSGAAQTTSSSHFFLRAATSARSARAGVPRGRPRCFTFSFAPRPPLARARPADNLVVSLFPSLARAPQYSLLFLRQSRSRGSKSTLTRFEILNERLKKQKPRRRTIFSTEVGDTLLVSSCSGGRSIFTVGDADSLVSFCSAAAVDRDDEDSDDATTPSSACSFC